MKVISSKDYQIVHYISIVNDSDDINESKLLDIPENIIIEYNRAFQNFMKEKIKLEKAFDKYYSQKKKRK